MTDSIGISDASDLGVYNPTLADKTREIVHLLQHLPQRANAFQTAVHELETALLSETELQALVSTDLSCLRNQIDGFQTFHLAKIGLLSQLSARYRSRLRALMEANDDAMNQSGDLQQMIDAVVKPGSWQCLLGLNSEMARVRTLLDERSAMYSRPLSVYLAEVAETRTISIPTPTTNPTEPSEIVFALGALQSTMMGCVHELATFWTHLMSLPDDSSLMIVLHRAVQQILTDVQSQWTSSSPPIPAFPTATYRVFDASVHCDFIEEYIDSPVDLWKYHGKTIAHYMIAQIRDALVSYIPPSMHALRIKAIASHQTAFDAHVVARVAYDLQKSGVRMLSSYNEQAHLHSVALVLIELLDAYASILVEIQVTSAAIVPCATVGLQAKTCIACIVERVEAVQANLVQMWRSQCRLGIAALCDPISNRTTAVDSLCATYTETSNKLDALSDVQDLEQVLPTNLAFPYTSMLARVATCATRVRASLVVELGSS
jgi:hypothetical protein